MITKKIKITFLDMAFGAFVLIIKNLLKNQRLEPLNNIAGFRLVEPVKKTNNFTSMTQGVYEKDGRKYFIKTWRGRIKDLNYFMLMKEFNNSKVLWDEYSQGVDYSYKDVAVPEIFGYITGRNFVSVVYDYIDGIKLEELSITNQVIYMVEIADFIKKIGGLIRSDRNFISEKGRGYYLSLLPCITLGLIIKSPNKSLKIIRSAFECLQLGLKENFGKLELSHGDFSPDNFIVKGSKVYITDTENMAFTLSGYDLSSLAAIDKYAKLFKQIRNVPDEKLNNFIYKYLCLHLSIGSGNFMQLDKGYLRKALT